MSKAAKQQSSSDQMAANKAHTHTLMNAASVLTNQLPPALARVAHRCHRGQCGLRCGTGCSLISPAAAPAFEEREVALAPALDYARAWEPKNEARRRRATSVTT